MYDIERLTRSAARSIWSKAHETWSDSHSEEPISSGCASASGMITRALDVDPGAANNVTS
jgi:hypothetical protein